VEFRIFGKGKILDAGLYVCIFCYFSFSRGTSFFNDVRIVGCNQEKGISFNFFCNIGGSDTFQPSITVFRGS